MAKAKLSDEVKTYIVQALACFDSPSVVAAAVKKEFGVDVSHDPNKKAASGLAPKWKALFGETRKTFLEDTATIAISHRAVRLRALQRMAEKAEIQSNMVLAASLPKTGRRGSGERLHQPARANGKGREGPAGTRIAGHDLPVT